MSKYNYIDTESGVFPVVYPDVKSCKSGENGKIEPEFLKKCLKSEKNYAVCFEHWAGVEFIIEIASFDKHKVVYQTNSIKDTKLFKYLTKKEVLKLKMNIAKSLYEIDCYMFSSWKRLSWVYEVPDIK